MKINEIRELNDVELKQQEKDLSEEQFNLKFQLSIGQLENTMRVRQVRKDLARIKTIINERKIEYRGGKSERKGS